MPVNIEDFEELVEDYKRMELALERFIDYIDMRGGVRPNPEGEFITAEPPSREDIADLYIEACEALGCDPSEQALDESPAG